MFKFRIMIMLLIGLLFILAGCNQPVTKTITSDGVTYDIVGGQATATSYTGTAETITLPYKIEGYMVAGVGANAFKDNATITKLEIRNASVIGDYAFANMTSLKELILPGKAITMGNGVLKGCNLLETLELSSEMAYELKYLCGGNIADIPESLSKIRFASGSSFIDTTMLKGDMKNATTLELEYMNVIPERQFENVTSLKKVILPYGVEIIGASAFKGCSNLESVDLPEGLVAIGDEAFRDCEKLKTLKIGKSVGRIGQNAFLNCHELTGIEIPERLQYIYQGTFLNCESLTDIVIPDGVERIDEEAFKGCHNLQRVVIPDSVHRIGADAFAECEKITFLVEASSKPVAWDWTFQTDVVRYGYLEPKENGIFTYVYSGYNSYAITGLIPGVTETQIIIPETIAGITVNAISESAFANNGQITSVSIPDTVESIFGHAFEYCHSLTEVVLPDSVKRIGDRAFGDCYRLTKGVNLSGVTEIPGGLFYGCRSLTEVELSDGLTVIDINAFKNCQNLKTVMIPGIVSQIDDSVFEGCLRLTILTDALTKPDGWHVGDCPVIYGSFETRDNGLFRYVVRNDNTVAIIGLTAGHNQSNIIIPETIDGAVVNTIVRAAFQYDSQIQNISIPDSVIDLNDYTFYSCRNLSGVIFGENASIDEIGDYAFAQTGLEEMILPESITSIGNFAFQSCTFLKKLVMPDGLTEIGNNAFSFCRYLGRVIIPDGVTKIGELAFLDCEILTNVLIPDSVTSVGTRAFDQCEMLTIFSEAPYDRYIWETELDDAFDVVWAIKGYGTASGLDYVITSDDQILIQGISLSNSESAITIPSAIDGILVTAIMKYAFVDHREPASVFIPKSIEKIGFEAFHGTGMLILVEADGKPSGWDDRWNEDNHNVQWSYKQS